MELIASVIFGISVYYWYVPSIYDLGEDIKVSNPQVDGIIHLYYGVRENNVFAYYDGEWAPVISGDGTRFGGVITDIKQAVDPDAYYALISYGESYYQYTAPKFKGMAFKIKTDSSSEDLDATRFSWVLPEMQLFNVDVKYHCVETLPEISDTYKTYIDDDSYGELHIYFVENCENSELDQPFWICMIDADTGDAEWIPAISLFEDIYLDYFNALGLVNEEFTFNGYIADMRQARSSGYYALFSYGYNELVPDTDVVTDALHIVPGEDWQFFPTSLGRYRQHYSSVRVAPIPDSYVETDGTKDITENGWSIDVNEYRWANVQVPTIITANQLPTSNIDTKSIYSVGNSLYKYNGSTWTKYLRPSCGITITGNVVDLNIADLETVTVDVPMVRDVQELPTDDIDIDAVYQCNGKLYKFNRSIKGTWIIDETNSTGTLELDGMIDDDVLFESNGETFSGISLRGQSGCDIYYGGIMGTQVYNRNEGTWIDPNYRTVTFLKDTSTGHGSLGWWLLHNAKKTTNVWIEYLRVEDMPSAEGVSF
jgi:hypothetical protein